MKLFSRFFSPLVTLTTLMGMTTEAQAQLSCNPPQSGEYLVLIQNPTAEIQAQINSFLPKNSQSSFCRYLNDDVLRVSGFRDVENASNWAQFVQNNLKTSTYVIAPVMAPYTGANSSNISPLPSGVIPNLQPLNPIPSVVVPSFQPTIVNPQLGMGLNSQPSLAFNPQRMPQGYAILVDHLNRPEIAIQLQSFLGRSVGLVSYGQRSYLLVTYSIDSQLASSTLQTLTNRGFIPLLVESERLILLTPSIQN